MFFHIFFADFESLSTSKKTVTQLKVLGILKTISIYISNLSKDTDAQNFSYCTAAVDSGRSEKSLSR